MNARQIVKVIEVEERELIPVPPDADPEKTPLKPEYKILSTRRFKVQKYPAMDGLKIAKVFIAKILPVFQTFIPLIGEARKVKGGDGRSVLDNMLDNLGQYLSLEGIAETLDKIGPDDLDYIMKMSLQNVFEVLPAGDEPVMNPDGTYGVNDIEFDPMLVLRLVCEVVLWGVGDFFDGNRWASIMSPLSSSLSRSRRT
jgi:hypothetical protein